MSSTLTGQHSIPSGTPVVPGPIASGQQLRLGESCANTFDPTVSGLARPVGSLLYTRDGTKAWQKTGTAGTAWTLFAVPPLPTTMNINDAGTNNTPDGIVEQHTTSAAPGSVTAGFGLVALAVELENFAGTTRRVFTITPVYTNPADTAEIARADFGAILAGVLTNVMSLGFDAIAAPTLFLGPPAENCGLRHSAANRLDVIVNDAAYLQLNGGVATVNVPLTCVGKVLSTDSPKQGANLTDANLTKDGVSGSEYTLPASTLTANRVLTLAVTGATTGQIIRVTRLDNTINLYTVKDDAATTLLAMTGKQAADFKFNGTHYTLDRYWNLN